MDPIAIVASAVWATMVSILLFLLPGAALGPVVLPGASTPLARVGRAAGVSLLATLLVCTLLARLGALTVPALIASLVGLTLLGFALHRPRLGRRPSRRRRRWWLAATAGIVLAGALIVVPSAAAAWPDLLPKSSTTWYYANLAQSMAQLGAIPAQLPEWGALRPFQTDYLPVTAHTAAALLLLPGDLLTDLEVYRLVTLALGLLFATLLFRRWVSGWAALLGAILLFGTVRLDQKFDGYRPETIALVLALFTLWVADRAFAERSRRAFGVALVASALVFLSHAEVFLVLAPALVGIGLARAVVAPGGRGSRVGLRTRGWRRAMAAPAMAVVLVVGGAALGAAGGWAFTGESRVLGYVVGEATPPATDIARGRPGEIPEGWTFTADPTWDFYVASVAPGLRGLPPPDSLTDTLLLPRSVLLVWSGLDGRVRSGLAVLLLLTLAPALAWPFLDARRRRFVLGWAIFGAGLVVGCLLLYAVADTYVPERTPGRRLFPYMLFLPVVALTGALWVTGRLLAPGWRTLLPGRGRSLAGGLALVLLTAGAVSASPLTVAGNDVGDAALSQTGYDAYRWIDANLPADARILTNAYTDGAVAAVAHRVGIVDGRAVYLENATFLAESTALSLGARVVFGTPSAPGAGTYLDREHVTHLLVATNGPNGTDLGGYVLFQTDVPALRADPRLRLVRSFDEDHLLLFEWTGGPVPAG